MNEGQPYFPSTSVYIHVVLSFRQELGCPLFLLTGHLSPLDGTIDVLLYRSVFHHLWTVEKSNPIVLRSQPHCTRLSVEPFCSGPCELSRWITEYLNPKSVFHMHKSRNDQLINRWHWFIENWSTTIIKIAWSRKYFSSKKVKNLFSSLSFLFIIVNKEFGDF